VPDPLKGRHYSPGREVWWSDPYHTSRLFLSLYSFSRSLSYVTFLGTTRLTLFSQDEHFIFFHFFKPGLPYLVPVECSFSVIDGLSFFPLSVDPVFCIPEMWNLGHSVLPHPFFFPPRKINVFLPSGDLGKSTHNPTKVTFFSQNGFGSWWDLLVLRCVISKIPSTQSKKGVSTLLDFSPHLLRHKKCWLFMFFFFHHSPATGGQVTPWDGEGGERGALTFGGENSYAPRQDFAQGNL